MTSRGRWGLTSSPVRHGCGAATFWSQSGLVSVWEASQTVSSFSFSSFGYLARKASSDFLLVGSQVFHVRQQEPGSTQTFEGQLGKACVSGKLYPLGRVVSSSDAMIAPPGPWNLLLWPGLLIRTSSWFLPRLKLSCVHSFCHVDLHSLDFFTYYLPNFCVFKHIYVLWKALACSHSTDWLATRLTFKPSANFQSEISLGMCFSLVEFPKVIVQMLQVSHIFKYHIYLELPKKEVGEEIRDKINEDVEWCGDLSVLIWGRIKIIYIFLFLFLFFFYELGILHWYDFDCRHLRSLWSKGW